MTSVSPFSHTVFSRTQGITELGYPISHFFHLNWCTRKFRLTISIIALKTLMISSMSQETQTGALYQTRGARWEGGSKGRGYMYTYSWIMLRFDRKQQNSIKQFSSVCSVAQSCPNLCDPMDCIMPGLPVHHWLPELTQTHVHWVGDTIQPDHPLSSLSPPAFNLSQHRGLFK